MTIRSILAIANELNLDIHQLDAKTAFLNSDLENEIYMEKLEGFEDKDNPDMVCKLHNSLYGLKQSARCWNSAIDHYLKEPDCTQSHANLCVYSKLIKKDGKEILMLISMYVDDVILASNNSNVLMQEKLKLSQNFEMEDQGEIHYCQGMSIKRVRDTKVLTRDQKAYLESVLKRCGMSECKPVSTPIEAGKRFEKLDDNEDPVNIREYQAAIDHSYMHLLLQGLIYPLQWEHSVSSCLIQAKNTGVE